ncbi:MAG: hypothetical protein ACLTTH_12435 [Holdemanella porci]
MMKIALHIQGQYKLEKLQKILDSKKRAESLCLLGLLAHRGDLENNLSVI